MSNSKEGRSYRIWWIVSQFESSCLMCALLESLFSGRQYYCRTVLMCYNYTYNIYYARCTALNSDSFHFNFTGPRPFKIRKRILMATFAICWAQVRCLGCIQNYPRLILQPRCWLRAKCQRPYDVWHSMFWEKMNRMLCEQRF